MYDQLLVVELSGIIDPDFLLKCQNKCKIVGIDTDQPVIQVDRCVFAGEYEDVLGTCIIFEEDSEHDPEAEDKPLLKYKCHTAKKLLMKRTFLSDKEGDESAGGVEYLKLNDNEFTRRAGLICNFLTSRKRGEGSGHGVQGGHGSSPTRCRKTSNQDSGSEDEANGSEHSEVGSLTPETPGDAVALDVSEH
ncbi:general transcription factor 3C polypeptide 6 [Callorhinchus milii]|uniref:general transcription factor 3C polypeptide 6 n=1 Tax=Callorhinchus milii TaxID=7868 RepID=UPI001C3FEE84|nr:general transcription factor 3C polypeptide 6 [Callorhinchus milii]